MSSLAEVRSITPLRIDVENLSISGDILNSFIGYENDFNWGLAQFVNPLGRLRSFLRQAKFYHENFWVLDNYVIKIIDNALVEIIPIPRVTHHANERLKQRFKDRYGIEGENIFIKVAAEIHAGTVLNKAQKALHRIKKKSHAVKFEDAIYILVKPFTLITVISV